MRCDLFCTVIDNYGDAGVCWRLARQLAREQGWQVRLLIDVPATLARLRDATDTAPGSVTIHHWQPEQPPADPAEVVISAFACRLPAPYQAAMAARRRPPVWVNLDYLSAEAWVDGCHGLASPQGTLTEFFFYPGFTPATGGLLREADLLAQRDRFVADPVAQAALWQALGTPPPAADRLRVSLFCYENPTLEALLAAWAAGPRAVWCGVPEGRIWTALAAWSGAPLTVGSPVTRGALTLVPLPFVTQDTYDQLLWACDLNFVRGEDSFVRAQWAGKPMIWHIYPQEEAAHRVKLDAFLQRYAATLAPVATQALNAFHAAWNGDSARPLPWQALATALPTLSAHARAWCADHAQPRALATNLVEFIKSRL